MVSWEDTLQNEVWIGRHDHVQVQVFAVLLAGGMEFGSISGWVPIDSVGSPTLCSSGFISLKSENWNMPLRSRRFC